MHKTIFFLIILFNANWSLALNWPSKTWEKKGLKAAGFSPLKFKDFSNYVFSKTEGHQTDGLVVIKEGHLIYENYANQYTVETKHLIWSISKSLTNALIGIAEKKKILHRNKAVSYYYPKLTSASPITINHLLQMSSGIKWNEGYEGNPLRSDVVKMLYAGQFHDMAEYTASRKVKYPAGNFFNYSSGESNLLMGILKKSLAKEEYNNFPWVELFNKLGITTATWEQDGSGTFVGSSYAYMTPLDLARFGLLYLREGKWKEENLLPKGWVQYSTQIAPAFFNTELGDANAESYGAHWWLNRDLPKKGFKRPYPDAPEDMFMGLGHHGQLLLILPSQKLVIVRTAADKKKRIDINYMLKLLFAAMEKKS